MNGLQVLRVEQAVARAHRAVWHAAELTEADGRLESAGDDLRQLLTELERIQHDLLRDRPRRRR
jgi:hypothetical protein